MIEAYIDNAGKYAEGKAYGDWLKFPTTTEQVQSLLSRIGVDGVNYQEIFFNDYKTDISGLGRLGQYESIDELNYLSSLLADLEDWELEKFSAVAVCSDYAGSARDLINLVQNLERYEYYPGVKGEEELGRYLINELEYEKIPEHLVDYFDYESYASDHVINEDGHFVKGGFVCRNQGVYFIEHYTGRDDIPEEYRVFAYPAPPERNVDMDAKSMTQAPPIAGNEHVAELLNLLEANNMPGAKELLAVVNQISAMENQYSNILTQLTVMRGELAEAQLQNHPFKSAMQKIVANLQGQALELRDKLNALKQDLINGCKSALGAFRDKGLSALRNIADFLKVRPGLEALQKEIDSAIKRDNADIARFEDMNARYHKAGMHLANTGRALTGKEAVHEPKPMGRIGKAFLAPLRADLACCNAMRRCVDNAIGAVGRLENTEHKPPIKETLEKHNREIAEAGRDAPVREHSRPVVHDGR